MASADSTIGHLWPSANQQLLLTAALGEGDVSLAAFRAWRERVDLAREFHPEVVRLLPLVYQQMQRQGVDDPIMGRLKGAYRRAWYDTNRLLHTVRPVVAALVAEGIDVVLLKGAPLALNYYSNAALRPMADVDLMVPPRQVYAALAVLRALGWHAPDPNYDTLRFRHAVQCLGPNDAEIDLHWHVIYEAASDDADDLMLATAEPVDFLGSRVRQLDPTGLLFLVIVHGVRWSEETPVRWIPDSMEILRHRGSEIDWDRIIAFASSRRLTHRLSLGLDYLAGNFAAPLPAGVLTRLRTHRVSLLEQIEKTVLLADNFKLERSLLGTQWLRLVEYCRYAESRWPLGFAIGFTHYLRYRMDIAGRRQLLPMAMRGVSRRVGHLLRPGHPDIQERSP